MVAAGCAHWIRAIRTRYLYIVLDISSARWRASSQYTVALNI